MTSAELLRASSNTLAAVRTMSPQDQDGFLNRLDAKILELHRAGDDEALKALQDLRRRSGVVHTRHLDASGNVLYEARGAGLEVWRTSAPTLPFGVRVDRPGRLNATSSVPGTTPADDETSHILGPIKHVLVDLNAQRAVRQEGWTFADGLETAFANYGFRLSDDTVQISHAVDVSADRRAGSVRLDRRRWDAAAERVAHIPGIVLVGDTHVEPSVGDVANPSRADLTWWRGQLQRHKLDFYIGCIVQRAYDSEHAWTRPVWTAFAVWRDETGATTCDVIAPELEPDTDL